MAEQDVASDTFTEFVRVVGPRLKQVLVASFGSEVGVEAVSEALAYGWEHWGRVSAMDNPAGYLYRVGRSHGRRMLRRRSVPVWPSPPGEAPWVEPGLSGALARLSERQRAAVLLVHGADWSLQETAQLMGITRGAVQKHTVRGLRTLRRALGGDDA